MKFYNKFDRFCMRNNRYGIKNLMLYIVIANVAVYLLTVMDSQALVARLLCYSREHILRGQVWRLLTYVIVPNVSVSGSSMLNGLFYAVMLYFYFTIGKVLQNHWGCLKTTFFYFSGTLLTSLFALLIGGSASSSYLNLTLFLAFASIYPDTTVLFFFVIPLKMKYLAWVSLGFEVLSIFMYMSAFPANLLPLAAIANYCLYFAPQIKNVFSVTRNRRQYNDNVVNFERARKQAEQQRQSAPFRHKCTVCGRTDTGYPDLEFRYCSRCSGYHCYCEDHISTHIHVHE